MNPSTSSEPPPFERTVCACEACRACCKRQPGPLAPGDFERIVQYIYETQDVTYEIAFEQVKKQLWASPGALVKELATGNVERVGTITPRYRKGRCVFLDENERCTIHPVAPFGCAYFDTHMGMHKAQARSQWLVNRQREPAYQALRDELPYATSYKPLKYDL
jgi:Fe-S-cluster containining protein